jgi:hypothetical protein
MRAILAIFKGEAQMAGAPEQVFGPPDTSAPTSTVTSTVTTPIFGPTTTLPVVNVTEIVKGFVPPKAITCP